MTVPRRVAIIGGGISGIACSWGLRRQDIQVDIFEADGRLGGHANSVPFKGEGRSVDVDTGFIAMDEATYPQFHSFLDELGVHTIPTDMSLSVSVDKGSFEWSSHSLWTFVGQVSRMFSFEFWRLIFDIIRFNLFAPDILEEHIETESYDFASPPEGSEADPGEGLLRSSRGLESIHEYLHRQGYSEFFISRFLIPMVAAPWCTDPDKFSRNFPARALVYFMLSHGLLDTVTRTLKWRSFKNGSKTYVDAFQRCLPVGHQVHLNSTVQSIKRLHSGIQVQFSDHTTKGYDHVVLAVHANQALRLLADSATSLERQILDSFKTSRNICYLHSDESFLPKRPSAQAAWNCFLENDIGAIKQEKRGSCADAPESALSLTFDMNRLQAIPSPGEHGSPGRVLVTMNPAHPPKSVQSEHVYYHPLISIESVNMARHLHKINGVAGVSFAGAWMGYGFHEDGFVAGTHVARMLTEGRENASPVDLIFGNGNERTRRRGGITRWIARVVISSMQAMSVGFKVARGS